MPQDIWESSYANPYEVNPRSPATEARNEQLKKAQEAYSKAVDKQAEYKAQLEHYQEEERKATVTWDGLKNLNKHHRANQCIPVIYGFRQRVQHYETKLENQRLVVSSKKAAVDALKPPEPHPNQENMGWVDFPEGTMGGMEA